MVFGAVSVSHPIGKPCHPCSLLCHPGDHPWSFGQPAPCYRNLCWQMAIGNTEIVVMLSLWSSSGLNMQGEAAK